jgi:hypothetical protein
MLETALSKLNDSHKSLNNPTLSSLNTPTSSPEETKLNPRDNNLVLLLLPSNSASDRLRNRRLRKLHRRDRQFSEWEKTRKKAGGREN